MREKTRHRGARRLAALALLALPVSFASSASAEIPPDAANHPLLQPIDAQNWVDQGELTWAAYKPVPDARPEFYDGSADGSSEPVQDGDHPDRLSGPAVPDHAAGRHASVRQPAAGLDAGRAGGRRTSGCTTTTPCRTSTTAARRCNGYWMEDSHGRIGVDVDVFGPYTMPGKSYEYGIASELQRRRREPGELVLSGRVHLQPEHPHRRRQRLAGRDRLRFGPVRLRQRLLRHRRSRRVVDVAGVRRDALDRPRAGPREVRAARSRGRPGR